MVPGDTEKEAFLREPQLVLHYYGASLFAFFLPLWQDVLPILSVLLVLNGILFAFRRPEHVRSAFSEKGRHTQPLLLIAFFLLYLIGTSFSENFSVALFDLQKKLGFLFFPLLFWVMPRPSSKVLTRILMGFLLGCTVVVFTGIYHALCQFLGPGEGETYRFLYGEHFAYNMHRGYLAMYLLFGTMVLMNWSRGPIRRVWPYLLLLPILLAGVFLTASRSALLVLPLLVIIYGFRSMKGSIAKRSGVVALAFLILGTAFFLFPRNQHRFQELYDQVKEGYEGIDRDSPSGIGARLLIWSVGKRLFLDNWLKGTGTGDEDAALRRAYEEKGWEFLENKRLNAHSQYLQTGLAIGVLGLLVLVGIFLKGLQEGWQEHPLLLYLSIILMVSALFESILERQAGILFMAFFVPLLAFSPERKAQN